jgi:ribosomal protein S4
MHSIFNCRVDVYIMRMFGIRTLKFARMLVSAGHVFRGSEAMRNKFDRVRRYDIMSISKKANIYLSKKIF